MKNVYKFVQWDVPGLETLKNAKCYRLIERLNNGEQLARFEKDNLSLETGTIKLMGYVFDFRPFMKVYLVKDKYYGWREIYGFDKTSVRNTYITKSHILKIIELGE